MTYCFVFSCFQRLQYDMMKVVLTEMEFLLLEMKGDGSVFERREGLDTTHKVITPWCIHPL